MSYQVNVNIVFIKEKIMTIMLAFITLHVRIFSLPDTNVQN